MQFSKITFPSDFPESAGVGTECNVETPLPPAATCTLTAVFTPTKGLATGVTSLPVTEALTLTTNSVSVPQQTVTLNATQVAPTAATPVLLPAGGTYTSALSVTITDATSGATIYYTTNGVIPTTSSTKYTGPISVSSSEEILAVAAAAGYSTSAYDNEYYIINATAAMPVFSPVGGTYPSSQRVTITDGTSGAVIYYTTNGTTPTASSSKYTSPITVSSSETLKAIAVASGYANSTVASASYTISTATATPAFSPAGGTYTLSQSVTITDATSGAVIYYTTNGTTPTTSSSEYTGPISVSSTETINAIAVASASGYGDSAMASATYTITEPAATPTFSVSAGTYAGAQSVTIADATAGATIYYTTNKTTPTTSSTIYTAAISVTSTQTIEAIAIAPGYSTSGVASATYTITPPAATPVFSPGAGTYTSAQSVSISDTTSGASIYYTTDGTTPTISSTLYSGAIPVSATETIQAIAVAAGYSGSAIGSAIYTINLPPPDFIVSVSQSSLTIAPGGSGTVTISLTPQNGFNAVTTFSCSGLPGGATCVFAPASVTPSGGVATTKLTVSAASNASAVRPNSMPWFPGEVAGSTFAMVVGFLGWPKRRSIRKWVLMIAVSVFGALLLSGCGGSSSAKTTTSAVSVIATSGSIRQTIPLTITIQ